MGDLNILANQPINVYNNDAFKTAHRCQMSFRVLFYICVSKQNVKDHGAVDLECLRDVPADKAKDYLLSIRGLGLKSVECVRLLTLHNLTFPVDTNVGRIAVRLGWVPLQPLPESLQLHLLELYPVLESIQKFLWPKLIKLGILHEE